MSIKEKIHTLTASYLQEFISIRRYLHQIPELGFEEFETSKHIASKLDEYGISYKKGIAKTGIVAIIEGKNPEKKVIALRADMDALCITETNNISYKSKNEGVMHACGHDVHIACVLGAAKVLNKLKNEFEGTVKFFFQPSEEKFPGGALAMINEKVLENPNVQHVIGLHTLPTLNVGKVGVKQGKYMASTDEIFIKVIGQGGHAATPELNIDPIAISSHILVELEKHFNKNKPQDYPSVLAFGKILGNGKTNIIPDEVNIEGTLRTYNEEWRSQVHEFIVSLASSISASKGGKCEVNIVKGYPVLFNNEKLTGIVNQLATEYLGSNNVENLEMRMTAEDFAYFAQKVPSCYFRLGIRNEEKGITSNLHTSTFDVDESCINTGTALMAWIAVNLASI